MSARNLQRALHAEDCPYQPVLDEVRSELARRYLADEANSVSQVSFLREFSEAAAFHRAFTKWTGVTPAVARKVVGSRLLRVVERASATRTIHSALNTDFLL
ncbi:helix-turn-helix domain-containing protein [Gemmatimonas sp.]|uniref:helix-turn-helix domain-containing protein n=1 Tax=Gemmatimonas sp. TaxID=1962908 RepID=UPI003983537F